MLSMLSPIVLLCLLSAPNLMVLAQQNDATADEVPADDKAVVDESDVPMDLNENPDLVLPPDEADEDEESEKGGRRAKKPEPPVIVPEDEEEVKDDEEGGDDNGKRRRTTEDKDKAPTFALEKTEDVPEKDGRCYSYCTSGKKCYKLKLFRARYCFYVNTHVSTGSNGCPSGQGCVGVRLVRRCYCGYIYIRRAVRCPPRKCYMDVGLVVDRSGSTKSNFVKQQYFFRYFMAYLRQRNVLPRFHITSHKPVRRNMYWSGNSYVANRIINSLRAGGLTDIGGALRYSCSQFRKYGNRCRAVLAASDGFSNVHSVRSAAQYCRSGPVQIDAYAAVGPYSVFGSSVMKTIGIAPGRYYSDFVKNYRLAASRLSAQMAKFCHSGCKYPTKRSLEGRSISVKPPSAWEWAKYGEPGLKLGVGGRSLNETSTDAPPEDESTAGSRRRGEEAEETATAGRRP